MRLIAEERRLGTIELLYTYPLRDREIMLGKFVACLLVFLLFIGGTTKETINPLCGIAAVR